MRVREPKVISGCNVRISYVYYQVRVNGRRDIGRLGSALLAVAIIEGGQGPKTSEQFVSQSISPYSNSLCTWLLALVIAFHPFRLLSAAFIVHPIRHFPHSPFSLRFLPAAFIVHPIRHSPHSPFSLRLRLSSMFNGIHDAFSFPRS